MNGEHPNTREALPTERIAQHTPGPWYVEQPLDFELSIVEANKPTHEWKFIANIPTSPEFDFSRSTAEANARLIAAAPDLLAACKAALGAFEHVNAINWDDLRRAIAKAEGRS